MLKKKQQKTYYLLPLPDHKSHLRRKKIFFMMHTTCVCGGKILTLYSFLNDKFEMLNQPCPIAKIGS